jgi:hypothetical protein
MVAVIAQMCLLTTNMAPFLALALAFLALMVSVTVFSIHTAREAGKSWALPLLTVFRETRFILYPAMLLLTEQPYAQLALLLAGNLLTLLLCLHSLYHAFRWSLFYLIAESLAMLFIEAYLLANQRLPLGIDYVIIAIMATMVILYALVTLRLVFISVKKVCFSIGYWLKKKKKNSSKIK